MPILHAVPRLHPRFHPKHHRKEKIALLIKQNKNYQSIQPIFRILKQNLKMQTTAFINLKENKVLNLESYRLGIGSVQLHRSFDELVPGSYVNHGCTKRTRSRYLRVAKNQLDRRTRPSAYLFTIICSQSTLVAI